MSKIKISDIKTTFNLECPVCGKNIYLVASNTDRVGVKHYCECRTTIKYRLLVKKGKHGFQTKVQTKIIKF